MRLLHTSQHRLFEYNDDDVPPYAVLSHTWGENEISYQDFLQGRRNEKILQCCRLAASESWDYVWIDTCCIDKSSSAELTEAINAMYRWYKNAEICYAHLADRTDSLIFNPKIFAAPKWFTRGWTLQELLASPRIIFLASNWLVIGSKQTLATYISKVTRISLEHLKFPHRASAAAKMSWMANRRTTRIEDMAYCLLGIFEVNMPLLYGEGERAFIRLQEEFIRRSDDQSIFAWVDNNLEYSGMLARHPSAFRDSGDIVQVFNVPHVHGKPYVMTNIGLEIQFLVDEQIYCDFDNAGTEDSDPRRVSRWEVPLACKRYSDTETLVFITLQEYESGKASRINSFRLNTLQAPRQTGEKRMFLVNSGYSLSSSINIKRKLWDPIKIVLSKSTREKFQYIKNMSGSGISAYDPSFEKDHYSIANSTRIYVSRGEHDMLIQLSEGTLQSTPSDVIEKRAAMFIGADEAGFLLCWSQNPYLTSPPPVDVLVASEITPGLAEGSRVLSSFEVAQMQLDSTDIWVASKMFGEGGGEVLGFRLRHEARGENQRLVIEIGTSCMP
ncbi:uncharacterized protein KY384_009261 [Bacidia gigantensis]|uniref:uncharacterized protein n=1 Tax=Bacidia gigantensis TaxID=2732470 RepID=UPI001D041036|nr:uncharacterized protein KY384_009261 [Bacidia gigantensis]KAG8525617.1 hypothetical protein KY384_009261 [Bacidia gigantensis]